MGMEAACKVTHKKQTVDAKVLLEGDHVLVRSPELKLKLMFVDLKKIDAKAGTLLLETEATGAVTLSLGDPAAEKWAHKIRNPPTRMDKLGIKPGMGIFHEGEFERKFHGELPGEAQAPHLADLLFFAAESLLDLKRAAELAKGMPPKAGIWIVYPKGNPQIKEIEVLEGMRGAGVTDVKVCSFSPTHTALKFVVPVAKRPKPLK